MPRNSILKIARLGAGYTQFALAEKVGVKESDITRFETGRAEPMPSVAIKIAELLKTNVSKLWPELFLQEKEVKS